jgi:phytanoyl-CoA hydroxylase
LSPLDIEQLTPDKSALPSLSASELREFHDLGYLRRPGFLVGAELAALRLAALEALAACQAPVEEALVEYEAETGYPGAPAGLDEPGGRTPRRLLQAYARFPAARGLPHDARLAIWLRQLLQTDEPCLAQAHHNCLMTKHPGYSSVTQWHQDNRYWRFERPELVTAWLALGPEVFENGALQVLPGSHHWKLSPAQLDADLFLRTDLAQNQPLLAQARTLELAPGDLLLFHSRLFHAAGRNLQSAVKLAWVFTFHAGNNAPLAGTRSAAYPSIRV